MKIRHGFVSNSSSSSFVLIGQECDKHLTKGDFDTFGGVVVMMDGYDGAVCVKISIWDEWRELMNYATDDEMWSMTFVRPAYYQYEPNGSPLGSGHIPDGLKVWGGEAENWPHNVKTVIEMLERERES